MKANFRLGVTKIPSLAWPGFRGFSAIGRIAFFVMKNGGGLSSSDRVILMTS
jgi:hypothetical protein